MAKTPSILQEEDRFDLTPMIDVVFLLLIYFMVTSTLIKEEADLILPMPDPSMSSESTDEIPNNNSIQILPDGTITLNGAPMDYPESRDMPQLFNTLNQLQQSANRSGSKMSITINANPESPHQRLIDTLDAAGRAGVKSVAVALPEDE